MEFGGVWGGEVIQATLGGTLNDGVAQFTEADTKLYQSIEVGAAAGLAFVIPLAREIPLVIHPTFRISTPLYVVAENPQVTHSFDGVTLAVDTVVDVNVGPLAIFSRFGYERRSLDGTGWANCKTCSGGESSSIVTVAPYVRFGIGYGF